MGVFEAPLTRTPTLLASVALLALLGACHRDSAPVTAAPAGPAAAPMAAAPAMPGMPPSGMPAGATATGTVLETMDASTYTYVHVKTDQGDLWAAANQFKVAKGDRVVVPLNMPMQNFESKTLHRTFPVIYFASSIEVQGKAK